MIHIIISSILKAGDLGKLMGFGKLGLFGIIGIVIILIIILIALATIAFILFKRAQRPK